MQVFIQPNTTGLVPLTDFDGEPIWITEPGADDIAHRKHQFHGPYHAALANEIARMSAAWRGDPLRLPLDPQPYPVIVQGTLPDFNIGTDSGASCDPRLEAAVFNLCAATGRSHVLNGRFKGGWTTRHYGQPGMGVHAIQMELAQSTHLATKSPPLPMTPPRRMRCG